VKIKSRKVLKASVGGGAEKKKKKSPGGGDYKSPGQAYTPSPGDTGGEGGNVVNTGSNNNQTGPGRPTKHPPNIPVIGPLTAGYNIIKNLVTPKQKAHPFSANTIKQTKQQTVSNQGDDSFQQLCPDGTYPPCKSPAQQIKSPAKKNMFLSGFKSYDDGGEVVISSNVDKDLL